MSDESTAESSFNIERIDHAYRDPRVLNAWIFLYYGDPANSEQLRQNVSKESAMSVLSLID